MKLLVALALLPQLALAQGIFTAPQVPGSGAPQADVSSYYVRAIGATTWRKLQNVVAAVSADRGDTSQTLTVGTDAQVQRWATTLTANRTVALSTIGAANGDTFRVVRTGLGAFTLDVGGGLKTIPNSTAAFVDVTYTGSAWVLTGYGTL